MPIYTNSEFCLLIRLNKNTYGTQIMQFIWLPLYTNLLEQVDVDHQLCGCHVARNGVANLHRKENVWHFFTIIAQETLHAQIKNLQNGTHPKCTYIWLFHFFLDFGNFFLEVSDRILWLVGDNMHQQSLQQRRIETCWCWNQLPATAKPSSLNTCIS